MKMLLIKILKKHYKRQKLSNLSMNLKTNLKHMWDQVVDNYQAAKSKE